MYLFRIYSQNKYFVTIICIYKVALVLNIMSCYFQLVSMLGHILWCHWWCHVLLGCLVHLAGDVCLVLVLLNICYCYILLKILLPETLLDVLFSTGVWQYTVDFDWTVTYGTFILWNIAIIILTLDKCHFRFNIWTSYLLCCYCLCDVLLFVYWCVGMHV